MDDIDGMLARLAGVASPSSLGDDPTFIAQLDVSATRGTMLGMAHSAMIGAAAAALMVAIHLGTGSDPHVAAGGPLLTTASGVVL